MTKILGIIAARGGSKRIPRKNVVDVAGRPLIAWTIAAAVEATSLARVIVTTDDEEIASVARAWRAEVPFLRPQELATDMATSLDVVLHAIDAAGGEPEAIMLLQPTSPLRTAADIDHAAALLASSGVDAVVSVTPLVHPQTWLRRLGDGGALLPYQPAATAEPLVELNGAIYLIRSSALRAERTFTPARTVAYVMPPERSIDVDTPWDLRLADLVLRASA